MLCTSKLHHLPIDFGDQIRLENLHDPILNNKEPQQCLHHMGPLRRRYNLLVDRAEMPVLPLVHQIVAQTLVVRLIHLDALLTEAQLHAHRAAAATATCCRLRGGRIFDGTRMAHLHGRLHTVPVLDEALVYVVLVEADVDGADEQGLEHFARGRGGAELLEVVEEVLGGEGGRLGDAVEAEFEVAHVQRQVVE